MCSVRSNVSLHFLQTFITGDPGVFLLISPRLPTRARDFKFAGAAI